jgi:hypothetical protein
MAAVFSARYPHCTHRACAQDAKARELPLEFIVIGSSQDDAALEATGKVFITGGYNEGEAAPLIQREEPDLAFFPAAWPETWSYTLDEALQAGLPIAAFDLGVIADRVRGTEYEMLFPFDLPARDINDEFMRRATKQLCAAPLEKATNDEEHKHGAMIEKAASIATLPQESLAASVHFLPLHAGLYSFSIGSGAQTSVIAEGNPAALQVPAIHVGFGPGVRAGQIEFMSAPDASGSWLYTKDDALITRINGSGATLMLTSVKSLTGEVLSVKIQRLDSRADNDVASRPAVAKSTAEDSAQHPATRPS